MARPARGFAIESASRIKHSETSHHFGRYGKVGNRLYSTATRGEIAARSSSELLRSGDRSKGEGLQKHVQQ